MGDSYSSGEGLEPNATTYISPSNTDGCHRSTQAYPDLVAQSLGLDLPTFNTYTTGAQPPTNAFVACSGATTDDVLNGFKGEPSQIPPTISPSVQYVTLTAGGDDLGFSGVIGDCTDVTVKLGSLTYTKSSILSNTSTCSKDIQSARNQVFSGSSAPSSLERN